MQDNELRVLLLFVYKRPFVTTRRLETSMAGRQPDLLGSDSKVVLSEMCCCSQKKNEPKMYNSFQGAPYCKDLQMMSEDMFGKTQIPKKLV